MLPLFNYFDSMGIFYVNFVFANLIVQNPLNLKMRSGSDDHTPNGL